MPVNELQKNVAKQIFRDRIGTVSNLEESAILYRALATLRPKGFRGSLLKRINWPTSWAVLYGLSPAQISQNRESTSAFEVFRPIRLGGVERIMMWKALLKAYFAGNPEPMSQVDFPSWRAPNWMSDSEKREINEYIRRLYEAEAPLDSTMRVEEMSADEEVVAEMSANMDGEEETVVVEESTTTTSPNVSQPDLIESLYTLYQPYWERIHSVTSADDMRNKMLLPITSLNGAAKTVLTLETLGYGYTGIKDFLVTMSIHGLMLHSTGNPNRDGFGAYFPVNLRGTRNARRYRSGKAYGIMKVMSGLPTSRQLKSQFEPSESRKLQVMAFRGQELAMGGYQVISMEYIDSQPTGLSRVDGVRKLSLARTDAHRKLQNALNALDVQESSGDAPTTASALRDSTTEAQAQVERAEEREANRSGEGFQMLGLMLFRPQMTFREDGTFIREGAVSGRRSAVFYFVHRMLRDNGQVGYPIYRIVWGEQNFGITGLPNFKAGLTSELDKIKDLWNLSGKLSRDNAIKLQLVTDPVEAQNVRNAWSGFGGSFSIRRYDSEIITEGFSQIKALTGRMNRLLLQEPEWAQGEQVALANTFLSRQQMINASKESFDQLTYAFELEAYVKQGNRRSASDAMNSLATNIPGALKYTERSGRTLPVNEGQFTLAYDGSIRTPMNSVGERNRRDEGWVGFDQAEFVSPVLFGKEGLEKVKYFCEIANEAGVRVNSSDGLHVHFDAHGRSPSTYKPEAWQLASLMYNYHVLHPVIDKYQNIGRILKQSDERLVSSTDWAKDFTPSQLKKLKDFAQAKKTDYKELYLDIYGGDRGYQEWSPGQRVSKYDQSRYRTVNIHASVSKNGTVEIRQGSPSTDYLYIQNWIIWMYYLIIVSKNGIFEKPSSKYGGAKYNEKSWTYCELFLPDNVASYITNTMYLVDGENIDMNRVVGNQRPRID